jgi:predicted dehydrogenase
MTVAKFGVVGAGWRAEFYPRLARLLPDEVEVVGAAVRSSERAELVSASWGVPVWATPGELVRAARPDFVITSVPWAANAAIVVDLVRSGVRVLSETPPAPDLSGLRSLWGEIGRFDAVQVAEQYPLLPGHTARLNIVGRGVIGPTTSAQVSSTHTYHAVALIRAYLGLGDSYEPVTVNASALSGPLVDPLDRNGWTLDGEAKDALTVIATLDFGDSRSGVYDFTSNQWHNRLRHRRIVVRGSRGEIVDDDIVYLRDERTVLSSKLTRQQLGYDLNLDGYDTECMVFEGEPVWRNPVLGHRLMDEEIAIAALLSAMASWAKEEGPPPYPLARACQDHLLGLAIDESLTARRPVRTEPGGWH